MRNKFWLSFIFLSFVILSFIMAEVPVNYSSGSYDGNILFTVNDLSNDKTILYSFKKDDPEPNIPFRGGMLLSALPGEERTYNISLKIDNELFSYTYKIDRKKPKEPQAVLINDNERGPGWVFINDNLNDYNIYYGWDDDTKGEAIIWEGELIPPPKSGLVYYYAMDKAGNKSCASVITPEKSILDTGRVSLEVKSPVEGDFANTQLLYIEKKGFEWIKYTLNGFEPEEVGSLYNGPVEIRRYGNVVLKIAAKPLNSSKIINREINYRVNTKAPLKNFPPSGIYSASINIKSRVGGLRYCLEDRSPDVEDPYFDGEININPVYGGIKCTVVRISNPDENELGDFRYYYVIDDRFPANPIIKFNSKLPDENIIDVNIQGPVYSDIYYTIDGSNPGRSSNYYNGPFEINIPENKNAGSIIIKARAISLNGKPSNAVSKIFTFDTKKPDKPDVSITLNEETGLYDIDYLLNNDEQLVYTVSNSDFSDPVLINDFSPINRSDFFLDIPAGDSREFNFIFAVIDSAGNMSEVSEVVKILIDKRIPSEPNVLFNNGLLTIESDYNVKYSYEILKNGSLIRSDDGEYTETIDISNVIESGTTLVLNLETTDTLGNSLNSKIKLYQPVEEVEKEAVLFSRKSEDIYSGSEVAFYAYPDGIDDELYYYLTENNADGSQEKTGPFKTDGYISISGEDNVKKDYFLEVYSINEATNKKSRINTYEFTIDNEVPRVPYISGLKNNSIVSDRVILKAESDGDSVVFLNYSDKKEDIGDLFSKSSIIFNKPIVFDVEPGRKKDFYLKIGAGDPAGNYVTNNELFHFTIDRELPDLAAIDAKVSISETGSYSLNIEGEDGIEYFYEYGLCGTKIRKPTEKSPSFTDTLELFGEPGKDNCYFLKVLAYNNVGNEANYTLNFMYQIDNLKPRTPDEPKLWVNDEDKKVIFLWEECVDNIVYRINIDDEYSEWNAYSKPISSKYKNINREMGIEYYAIDEAGNKSKAKNKVVRLPSSGITNLVEGVENNSFYKSDLSMSALDDERIIRYEISTDKIFPADVSVFSPVLPEVLPFRIEEGESINFVVSLKEFNDENDLIGGAEQVLRFTIDKQIPEAPEIEGITDGEYYLSDCTALFKERGDTIYYSIEDGLGNGDDFIKYVDAFDIASPQGTYRSYKIKAYSEDFSGNKSAVKSWEITIDKEIIYVSENGKDYFEGTRSKPFRSLNKALEQVKASDRKTLFIEEGIYELNSPSMIDETVTLYGGFKIGSWQDKSGITEILINRKFADGNPAFYIYGGNLTIENILIKSSYELNSSVFFVNKGVLNIRNSEIQSECGDNSSFLEQNYGKLIINNTDFSGKASNIPYILNDYGVVSITNCNFDIDSDSSEVTILKADNCSEYSISSSKISASGGQNIKVLSFKNSDVRLKSDVIMTGNANVSSVALQSIDSRIDMDYCRIESFDSNRIARAVISEDSNLDFNSNKLALNAVAGVIGFSITGGESNFYNNSLKTGKCNDFTYLFMMSGGNHGIETNLIDIAQANEIVNMRVNNSDLDFLNNTLKIDGGRKNTILFKTEGKSINRIINNIFINRNNLPDSDNTIIYNSSESSMISFKNNCSWGWKSYLSGNIEAYNIIDLDLADGIYSGGRFSGNIEEDPEITFAENELYKLSEESNCIDSGFDLKDILIKNADYDGELRPNKSLNPRAAFDIGVDEYYE